MTSTVPETMKYRALEGSSGRRITLSFTASSVFTKRAILYRWYVELILVMAMLLQQEPSNNRACTAKIFEPTARANARAYV